MPFEPGTFDGAVFLNSLHHVPDPLAALMEASRVLKPGGVIVVVEPVAKGSSFEALRLIDDETEIRQHAQDAVAEAIASGVLTCDRDLVFERVERFGDVDQFLKRVVAVNPARTAAVDRERSRVASTFERVAERDSGAYLLRQPLRAHVLVRPILA